MFERNAFPATGPDADYYLESGNIIDEGMDVDYSVESIAEISDQPAVADGLRAALANHQAYFEYCYPAGIASAAAPRVRPCLAATGVVMVALVSMLAFV